MPPRSVLLVNPNFMCPPIAPIGLEYLAAALKLQDYTPELCDLAFAEDWRNALDSAIDETRPMAIVVSIRNLDDAYFASQDFILERTARVVRHIIKTTAAPVVLGGVGFSIAPAAVLKFCGAQYGAAGEGEAAVPQLLDCLTKGGNPAEVPGAVYRSGGVIVNPPVFADLSALPTPSRSFLNNRRYFTEGGQAGIETKRGCGMPCIYCVEPHAKGARIRLRAPSSVADEFADLLDQGIDAIHLCDSEFNLPPQHAVGVCEALIQRGLASKVRWYTYAAPKPFDKALAKTMARAGCAGINFGVDHADPHMLRRLGRNYGPEEIRTACEACRGAGLAVMFDMLFGSPGETKDTIARAIEFIQEIRPDRVGLSCGVRVYPNTPLAATVLQHGPLHGNAHLHGTTENNDDLLRPIFYVDPALGASLHRYVSSLIKDDPLFLHANPDDVDGNYNYNDNSVLAQAIRNGERGAYWDILRRLEAASNST